MAHRIIWKHVTGNDPEFIDHINHDRTDNRIENLRSVSTVENCQNQTLSKSNKSGVLGVHWNTRQRKWIASIRRPGVGFSELLGRFDSVEEAAVCRRAAETEANFHPNHGRQ
jgi:hypothetical protein